MKGILIEFTPQSQELVIQTLKLTHLPSVTIQSKYENQLYDCNLKENQLWECVKDAFKQSDIDLYEQLKDFISMDDIKDLYLKYKNEFEKNSHQQSNSQSAQSSQSNLFNFSSSIQSMSKIILIAFCIIGFVIGINTLQNLLNGYKYMIFILCILTYILCMSGTVFNMIQNPPPYQYNPRENSIQFFYPSMRMSFALEGYIATFVIVISSFYFIAIPYYGYYDNTNNNNNTSNTSTDNTSQGEKNTVEKNTTSSSSGGSSKKNEKKKKNTSNNTSNNLTIEELIEEQVEEEKTIDSDSHYKSVLKRLFFIWGFIITFGAAMIFFMIKTSFYLSDTPYQGWVQLLLAIFNH